MGIMIDSREVTEEQLRAVRAEIKQNLLAMVSKKSNKPTTSLIVRDILPATDLGLNTEEWDNQTELASGTWTKDWDHQLDDDEGVVFYGVHGHDDASDIMFARFKLGATGATVKDLISVQAIDNGVKRLNKGYFGTPVYYIGKEHIYIDYYARATVAAAAGHIELMGMFCEPSGEQIS